MKRTAQNLFLALSLSLVCQGSLFADTIKLTTLRTTGSAVTLFAMADTTLTIDWGNGNTEEVASDTLQGNILGQVITLHSVGTISSLDCSNSQISNIDLSDAAGLQTLYCSGNPLQTIHVDSCAELRELDCSRCGLEGLAVSNNIALRLLNCDHNNLSELSLNSCRALEQLDCSYNALQSLHVDSLAELQSLWAQGNQLTEFSANQSYNLFSLNLDHNALSAFASTDFDDVEDLFLSRNALSTLDLSNLDSLNILVCDSNALETLELSDNAAGYLVSCENNRLELNDLYPPSIATNYLYAPQANFSLPLTNYALRTVYNFNSYVCNHSGSAVGTLAFYDAATGEPLTRGASGDYFGAARQTRFLTSHDSVVMQITSTLYPALVLRSEPFAVGTPTGVVSADVDEGLSMRVDGRTLRLRAGKTIPVTVWNVSGMRIWSGRVGRDEVSIRLLPGVYIVNNKKILIR